LFGFGTPSASIAQVLIDEAEADGSISTKLEAYMAVAQLSWESAGFTTRREWACRGDRWFAWPCESYDKHFNNILNMLITIIKIFIFNKNNSIIV
jgi:hypothetical protein